MLGCREQRRSGLLSAAVAFAASCLAAACLCGSSAPSGHWRSEGVRWGSRRGCAINAGAADDKLPTQPAQVNFGEGSLLLFICCRLVDPFAPSPTQPSPGCAFLNAERNRQAAATAPSAPRGSVSTSQLAYCLARFSHNSSLRTHPRTAPRREHLDICTSRASSALARRPLLPAPRRPLSVTTLTTQRAALHVCAAPSSHLPPAPA